MKTYFLNNKAQNLIEYSIVIALVAAAMIAMSTYAIRSMQGAQKTIEEELN